MAGVVKEDWTFREVEVRLTEHSDLRAALGLQGDPDFTTLYRFLRRLEEGLLAEVLATTAQLRVRLIQPERTQTTVVVDGTGLATSTASTYFIRQARNQQSAYWCRHWVKWVLAVDVPRRQVVACFAREGPCNASASFRPLVDTARAVTPIGTVLADVEFDSEQNHQHVRKQVEAHSIVPAKRGKAGWKVAGVRAEMRRAFPRERHRERTLVQSIISAAKRKPSSRAPGRLTLMEQKQALLLGIAYNCYRLHVRRHLPVLILQ